MSWFNWLPLSDRKNMDFPTVIVEPHTDQNYAGYYTRNEDGRPFIYIVEGPDCARIESTLAHEFRHHTQDVLNQHNSSVILPIDWDLPYEEMIRTYFRTQTHELDALLYEHKHARTRMNDWWLRALVLPCWDDYIVNIRNEDLTYFEDEE